MAHKPVLLKEVLQYLDPKPNQNFIDCTIGSGGHTKAILKKIQPDGKILGIDLDPNIKEQDNLVLVKDSYSHIKSIAKQNSFGPVNGILLDLGMSTRHLKESGRGFSFLKSEPLDMRFDIKQKLTAQEILNSWQEKEIEKTLKEYGEERFSRKISQKITEQRKKEQIKTTFQLVEIIKSAVPRRFWPKKIHVATKTFQALRIAVNNELSNIKNVLPKCLEILAPKGKIVVISFHSLEDKIVKQFFKQKQQENLINILFKKPISPSRQEISANPASRSAKLRAAEKI